MDLSTSITFLGQSRSKSGPRRPETDSTTQPGITQGELSDESPPPGSATLRQGLGVDRKPPPLAAPVAVASIAGSHRTCPQVCSPATGEQTARPTHRNAARPTLLRSDTRMARRTP